MRLRRNTREFLVRQQTRVVNAMRAHPGGFGIVAPKDVQNFSAGSRHVTGPICLRQRVGP
jgi:hypothetical protein